MSASVPTQSAGLDRPQPLDQTLERITMALEAHGTEVLDAARASSQPSPFGAPRPIAPAVQNERARVRGTRVGEETRRRSTVSLVIPAKNEARNLPHVLEALPDGLDEVILVDGHSTDVSRIAARACRPDIRIVAEPNPGKGWALRAGFAAAAGELVIAMDADGSMSPAEIPHLVHYLENGYDFVKGSRFIGGGGSLDITPIRRLGNRALLTLANSLYGVTMTDLCYGFFGFRRCFLEHLALRSSGFEIETELTIRACVAGLRLAEVPSVELPRRNGRSNLHAVRDGIRVLKTLFEERERVTGPVVSDPVAELVETEARAQLPESA